MEMDFASMKRRELQALCKRHGLSAGGSNVDLVARLSSTLSEGGAEGERMVGVVVGKGCLKRLSGGSGGSGGGKTVTFVLDEEEEAEEEMRTRGKGRGRRGRRPRVTWSPVAAKAKGRQKAGEVLAATEAASGGAGKQRRGAHVSGVATDEEEGVAGEPAADEPRRRSRRNAANLSDADGAASRTDSVSAEGDGEAVDKKRKHKITVSVQDGVPGRSTRSSRLVTAVAVVESPVVEKNKRGRKRKADVKEQICLEVQEQPAKTQNDGRTLRSGSMMVTTMSPPVAECKRSRRKAEDPIVEKAAKVNVSGRATRSSSVAAAMVSPVVLDDKRKMKEHVHLDAEVPTVPVVQANVAPNARSLRNRVVQVNDSVIGETYIGKKLENKRQSCRPSIQHQELSSFVEEEDEQTVPAPSMGPKLRRSRRRQSAANAFLLIDSNSDGNNISRALTDSKGLKTSQPLTHNAANTSMKDIVVREDNNVGLTKRNTGRGSDKIVKSVGKVPFSESTGEAFTTEMQLEIIEPLRRSRRKSVVSTLLEEGTKGMYGSVRGDDLEKQPIEKRPVRRSTRKSVVSTMLEKESNGLTTEMIPEAHIRRSKRKSFLPNMLNDENMDHCEMARNEELKASKDIDAGKKLATKEPARRSTRTSVVPGMLDGGMKGLMAEMNPEVHVRISTRKSVLPNMLNDSMDHCEKVRNEELKNSKGEDAGKKLAVREPSRRSTRKSVVSHLEKEAEGLLVEMNPKVHVRRSTRKSVVPNMLNNENKYNAVGVAVVKQLEAKKPVRSNEGGLKLEKLGRNSIEMSCSSSKDTTVSDMQKSSKQQKAQTLASEEQPAKKSRTCALQEINSFEEPNADAMVVRESTQDGDEGGHEYCKDSIASSQEVSHGNATVEELSLGPLLVRLPKETCSGQRANAEVHGSDSGGADKQGENPELCQLVAAGSTRWCDETQEYVDFRTESIHLSGIRSEELSQSSNIAEPVPRAGISSENKTLLDDAVADLCATVTQTLNADSNEEVLEPSAIAEASALPLLEADARTDDDLNSSGVESSVGIQDVIVTLPEQLLGSLAKLPIAEELPPCTSGAALAIVNDSHTCNVANWTAVEGTEDIQNVDIALSDGVLEAFKSMTAAEVVQSCTAATDLDDATLVDNDFERTCMKNSDASLSLVDSGSSGNEIKSLEFKLDHIPAVNCETGKQSNKGGVTEVASQQFHGTTVTVEEYNISCQNETHDVRTYIIPSEHDQPCSDKINSDEFSILSRRSEREPLDVVPINFSAEVNEEQYPVSPVTEEIRVNRENTSESAKKSLSNTELSCLHTQDCRAPGQLIDVLAKETSKAFGSDVNSHQCTNGYEEADNWPGVQSDAAARKSIQGDDLCKNLSTGKEENPVASNLDLGGASEDKSMLPIPINAEGGSSEGRHSSFGLKSLFAKGSNRQCYLIDDENIAAKVGTEKMSVDCKTSTFHMRVDCDLEDDAEEGVTDNKIRLSPFNDSCASSSYGRNQLFGQISLYAQEGAVSNVANAARVSVAIDCTKDLDNRIPGLHMESDSIHTEIDVGPVSDNTENKLAPEPVVQGDSEEGIFGKHSLSTEIPDCKHLYALPNEAVVHSAKNKRCSSTVEQLPSSPQSMSLQGSVEETLGHGSLSFARAHSENRVDESNDCHAEYSVARTPTPEPVADHGSHVDLTLVAKMGESNEKEGIIEKPAINFATPDCKFRVALSEEVIHSQKNDAGTLNPKDSPFGLQFLFSEENMDGSRPHEVVAFPCAEKKVDEPNVSHVKCRVEKTVSSEPGFCEGSQDTLENAKEIGVCISSCQQVNEQEEFSEASHKKGGVASVQLNISDDVNQSEREIISEEVVCEQGEKMGVMSSSDIDTPVRESLAIGLATNASPVSKTQICDSQSIPICDEVHPSSIPSKLEPPDVFHHDHEVLCSEHNEDQALPGIPSSGFIEAVSIELPENEIMLLEAADTSELLDEKLNPKPECDELEEQHNLSCVKDTEYSFDTQFVKYSVFRFTEDNQETRLPNDQYGTEAAKESAFFEVESAVGTCETSGQRCLLEISTNLPRLNTEILHENHKEEGNVHKEDQVMTCIPTIDMSGAASTNRSEGGITLLPDAELSVFIDVQLNSKLEKIGEHNLSCDEDTRSIFDNKSSDGSYHEQEVQSVLSASKSLKELTVSLVGSVCMDSCNGQAIPKPKSPEDYQDDRISESVGDMFEPASAERTEQGTTLLSPSETSVYDEEQFNNPNLVSVGGHNHICDEDTSNMFHTESVQNNTSEHEQELPNDVSAPISLKESAICQDDSVHTESCDGQAIPNDIPGPESVEDYQDDRVSGPVGVMFEPASTERTEQGTTLLSPSETSVFDEQFNNPSLVSVVGYSRSCDEDTRNMLSIKSVQNNSEHEQEFPNDVSAPISLKESTSCQDNSVHTEPCDEQALPKDIPGPKSPEDYQDDRVSGSIGDMFEPVPTERTEQDTETSVFEDTSNMFKTESVQNNNEHEQELPNDISAPISLKESPVCQDNSVHTESCYGHALPEDIPAPKSPEEPSILQDDSVLESAGICQTSGRRRIDEISTKLLSFKISSTVKPSHIALNAPRTNQANNLSQSAIALLRNTENTPAIKTDRPVKPNPDRSVAKNSSRRPLQLISRRPEGH